MCFYRLVFDDENIKNEHCVMIYDSAKVLLTPKDGCCHVNSKAVVESIKLCQGDEKLNFRIYLSNIAKPLG